MGFPGCGFKRKAHEWSQTLAEMVERPHNFVKQQIVRLGNLVLIIYSSEYGIGFGHRRSILFIITSRTKGAKCGRRIRLEVECSQFVFWCVSDALVPEYLV